MYDRAQEIEEAMEERTRELDERVRNLLWATMPGTTTLVQLDELTKSVCSAVFSAWAKKVDEARKA